MTSLSLAQSPFYNLNLKGYYLSHLDSLQKRKYEKKMYSVMPTEIPKNSDHTKKATLNTFIYYISTILSYKTKTNKTKQMLDLKEKGILMSHFWAFQHHFIKTLNEQCPSDGLTQVKSLSQNTTKYNEGQKVSKKPQRKESECSTLRCML